ncbi:MAG TPA: hypothetical protein VFK38_10825 [Candidatus Limnocylindrales bacterium]|nr:hypothetical protein [Candidatus Limnocylindrales bacterium]
MKTFLAPILLALLASACGLAPGGSPAPSSPVPPSGADQLVFRIETRGGNVPPEWSFSNLPSLSIYGDGRVVTMGPQVAIYPGPAMPNLQVQRLSPAGISALLAAARDAGLLVGIARIDHNGVADAATTRVTIVADGRVHRIDAYYLEGADDAMVPEQQRPLRRALAAFLARVADAPTFFGPELTAESQPYVPHAMRLLTRAGDAAQMPEPGLVNVRDWPIKAVPLLTAGVPAEGFGEAARCVLLEGGALVANLAVLSAANELTMWRDAGVTYLVRFRPLLPDETGCISFPDRGE